MTPEDHGRKVIESPTSARGRRTRAAIIAAGRRLFEDRGFGAVTIDDIAAAAQVAHGSLYTYFSSKYAVFEAVVAEFSAQVMHTVYVRSGDESDRVRRIRETISSYFRLHADNAKMFAVLDRWSLRDPALAKVRLASREPFVGRIAAGLERLQRSGSADPQLDPRCAASLLACMVEQAARLRQIGDTADLELVLDTTTRLWAQAIGLSVPAMR